MRVNETSCCGLREISGLSEHRTPAIAMQAFCRFSLGLDYNYNGRLGRTLEFSHAVFTAATGKNDYGEKFAAFILRNKLGTVTPSQRRNNPNSGNPLKVWVWTLHQTNVKKWAQKHQL